MQPEEKEHHSAEECLLDLMKQGLPPEEVIRQFREKGYSLEGDSEKEEVETEEEEVDTEEDEEKEEEGGVLDLKIKKVSVMGDEELPEGPPRMAKLIRVARKAMKKERGE